MNRYVIFVLFLILLPTSIYAGDVPPLPPDPASIFAPDVEVLNVAINLPPIVDNKTRTIQVLNEQIQGWQTFNYPSEIGTVRSANNEDGLVLLNVEETDPTISYVWIFNPTEGTFRRYENACVNWDWHSKYGYSTVSPKPHWEFYNDEKLKRTSLCYTGTETSEYLLPKDGYWSNIDESPDGQWLILWNTDQFYYSYMSDLHVYSYNLASKQLTYLGTFPMGEGMSSEPMLRWISSTEGLYYSGGMPESAPRMFYYFDLTKPDSLVYFMNGWADYHDNPPHYEYLQTYHQVVHRLDVLDYPPCIIESFYFSQWERKPQSYTLGDDCFGNVVRHQNTYFYVSYGESERTTLSLYSLDTETNEQKAWFSDKQLLALDSISLDGRYAVLMLNDGAWPPIKDPSTGHTAPLEDLDPWIYSYHAIGSSHIAIFDTHEQKIVYETTSWEDYGATQWLDNNAFIAFDIEGQHPVHLFRLTEKGLVRSETMFPDDGGRFFSPNQQLSIIKRDSQFLLYNALTGKTTPFINEFQSDTYEIASIKWLDNTQIKISVYRIKRVPFEEPVAIYTIRIPQ